MRDKAGNVVGAAGLVWAASSLPYLSDSGPAVATEELAVATETEDWTMEDGYDQNPIGGYQPGTRRIDEQAMFDALVAGKRTNEPLEHKLERSVSASRWPMRLKAMVRKLKKAGYQPSKWLVGYAATREADRVPPAMIDMKHR